MSLESEFLKLFEEKIGEEKEAYKVISCLVLCGLIHVLRGLDEIKERLDK